MGTGHKNGARYKTLVRLPNDANDCWPWIGYVHQPTGYGHKQWNSEKVMAHRWVYEMLMGKIPDGMQIDHLCGTRHCVNPTHLQVVTPAENCRRGKNTKLTHAQAREIKQAKATRKWGDGPKLAATYGVSVQLIHDIWNGRAWADIT